MQRAIETSGAVDEQGRLHLDRSLDVTKPQPVRVILLFETDQEDVDEPAWLRAAARNPAFAFLSDAEEDRYTLEDGRPFDEDAP